MSSKHTPLPWSLKTFSDGAFILTEGTDVDDPKYCVIASRNEHDRPEESIANAELMADAPSLLKELRVMRDYFASAMNGIGHDPAKAYNAIQRATKLLNKHGGRNDASS